MKFADMGNVSDMFPEVVPSLAPWQSSDFHENLTMAAALHLSLLFSSGVLGPNYKGGLVCVVPNAMAGGAQAPFIPIDIALEGFKALGSESVPLCIKQEVRVLGPDGVWRDAIADLGKIAAKWRQPTNATDKLSATMDVLMGEMTAQGVSLAETKEQLLFQVDPIKWAVETTAASIINQYKI